VKELLPYGDDSEIRRNTFYDNSDYTASTYHQSGNNGRSSMYGGGY
jgi:hypothetical protein